MDKIRSMKAIDLYAGIGGWSLGLKLAGIEVVRSFEWWRPAALTHSSNLKGDVQVVDIRKMPLDLLSLPDGSSIDVVVGSPPCTQFSYANRGGSGDLADGLVDIQRFMEVVRLVQPKFWAFENVPRVAKVVEKEARKGGALEQYGDLLQNAEMQIVDMSNFGVPQRRKRCIIGNLPFELLASYQEVSPSVTLGDVLSAIHEQNDPVYRRVTTEPVTDVEREDFLSDEEARFNRDMKRAHPVYNGMEFPEPLNRTSRTITATCTRVSRESLIVGDTTHEGKFRRLSVRERASLQGFPVDYQFHGSTHAEKLKMIGNAIPPAFTYFVAHSMLGTPPTSVPALSKQVASRYIERSKPIETKPDRVGKTYPETRRFRFSVPNLRFKSGTRFELSNVSDPYDWQVRFFFGDSKRIREHVFDFEQMLAVGEGLEADLPQLLEHTLRSASVHLPSETSSDLQLLWSHRVKGTSAFLFLDKLGEIASSILASDLWLETADGTFEVLLETLLTEQEGEKPIGLAKLKRNARSIIAGAVLAVATNESLRANPKRSVAAE